ncbi:Nicotinate dehydrogenase FAD-subunit [compost metagenome]
MIALGARVVLRKGSDSRELPIDEYFIDYKVTARQEGEFIEKVIVPRPQANQAFRAYKVSKRLDDDISAVCAAFSLTVENCRITAVRTGFGGMAAIPKRAAACEAALLGQPFNAATFERAAEALAEDFTPLSDFRASKEYRLLTAQNLLRKCFFELEAPKAVTRVTAYA